MKQLVGFLMVTFGAFAGGPPEKYEPTVRLIDARTGFFFCSGSVITDDRILTAAHCVQGMPLGAKIEIRLEDGTAVDTYATEYIANGRADVAVIKGDFRLFKKMPYETDTQNIINSMTRSKHILLCGFPWGGKKICMETSEGIFYNFAFTFKSYLWPGMSGGPVIDEETGKIVGVNSAVNNDDAIVSPIVEIWSMLRERTE